MFKIGGELFAWVHFGGLPKKSCLFFFSFFFFLFSFFLKKVITVSKDFLLSSTSPGSFLVLVLGPLFLEDSIVTKQP